ncbi:glucose-methanol-choline oxidoreductase-like protein [Hypoxylon trugodes]|uniref:glucose-methanol-choline oxidoreductase-like protein n=1 Tax=Hypoxylon trugodes TaxID=326681 RepID=UPI00219C6E52|nr:glucose-methanol-choline oxidoreductase-like protein [Hypoxylon trugodes]KAI1390108.1 glucose-methanol-choline oxidoreductase-like protein [Hypoxylon trugodes]
MDSKHDFVIVGGGLAGLVVAARLTEDPQTTVIVLEAGSDSTVDPRVRTPGLWPSLLGSEVDWNYHSVPQKGLNGKVVACSQGKLLGGSSAINGQAFVANSKAAIDVWAEFGNPGWDWETLAPYYKKSHTLSRPSAATCDVLRLGYIDDAVRGTDGPIRASFPDGIDDPLPTAWVDTIAALGFPASGDPFSGEFTGGYVNAMNIDPNSSMRSDAASAYLEPAKGRKNLHVETGVLVEKIVFDESGSVPKAVGVQVQKNGRAIVVDVNKEIILAAGAFGSPKLLELSGIGSRVRLEKLGIPVIVDNPNVGENLQDHPNAGVSFEVVDGVKTMDDLARQVPEAIATAMQDYATKKTGPFSVGGNFAGSMLPVVDFVEGPDSEQTLKDVLDLSQEVPTPDSFSSQHASFVHSLLSKRTEGVGNVFTFPAYGNFIHEGDGTHVVHQAPSSGNFLTIVAAILFPLSRGSVHIASANPADEPIIDPRYLEHPLDLDILARFVRYLDTIVHTEPLSRYLKPNGRRGYGAPTDLRDLAQVKGYVEKAALSCYHPTSACAMLPREKGGVVDPKLGVYGVEGLRVVDSSIMPIATRGNPQTTVYAVAERAADLIREIHNINL